MRFTKLKRVVSMTAGGTPTSDDPEMWANSEDEGTPWLAIGDMSSGALVTESTKRVTDVGLDSKRLPVGKPGDILFAMYASVGACAELGIYATWNQAILGLRPRENASDNSFVRYWLTHLRPQLDRFTSTNTQANLNAETVGNLPFPDLAVSEQRRIAEFLDGETGRIDTLITEYETQLELVEEDFSALIVSTVLSDIDPFGGASQVSEHRVATLNRAMELQRGFDLPEANRVDGEFPIVSSGGVSGSHDVKGWDGPGLVTGRYGTIGEVYFIADGFWPLNTTLFARSFRGHNPRWCYYLLRALPLDFDSAKSAVTGINRNVINRLACPIPTVPDQARMAAQLDLAAALAEERSDEIVSQIESLRELRQALITTAVTEGVEACEAMA